MNEIREGETPDEFHRRMIAERQVRKRESEHRLNVLSGAPFVAAIAFVFTVLIVPFVLRHMVIIGMFHVAWNYGYIILAIVFVNVFGLLMISYVICYSKTPRRSNR